MNHVKYLFIAFLFFLISIFYVCSQNKGDSSKNQHVQADSTMTRQNPKVTFVELGSVNCIPCKMMQPVMEAIEQEFGEQIKVIFYISEHTPAVFEHHKI